MGKSRAIAVVATPGAHASQAPAGYESFIFHDLQHFHGVLDDPAGTRSCFVFAGRFPVRFANVTGLERRTGAFQHKIVYYILEVMRRPA